LAAPDEQHFVTVLPSQALSARWALMAASREAWEPQELRVPPGLPTAAEVEAPEP